VCLVLYSPSWLLGIHILVTGCKALTKVLTYVCRNGNTFPNITVGPSFGDGQIGQKLRSVHSQLLSL
jgi:hypothetical protein